MGARPAGRAGGLARRSARLRAEAPFGRARLSRSGGGRGARPQVVVMVKEPRPGRVKTRLARDLGAVAAARWFRLQALATVRRLAADLRWDVTLAVAPDREGLESRVWPAGLPRRPQGRGDIGARMRRALREAGPGPVLVVGADIPALGPAQIARAFAALRRAEIVFGPAEDGGFWLVGVRRGGRVPPRLFEGARWSGPHALSDCLAGLRGRRVTFADRLSDVDEAADLDRLGLPRP